jgi:nucleotidyltransferase/DNA polymerase involved in DNA repair
VASIGDGSAMPSMISVADRLVQELRQKVITATGGLTCSAGIACNPMLAKVMTCWSNVVFAPVVNAVLTDDSSDCIKLQQAKWAILCAEYP